MNQKMNVFKMNKGMNTIQLRFLTPKYYGV